MVTWHFNHVHLMKKILLFALSLTSFFVSLAQYHSQLSESAWIDSVFNTLKPEEKIAQLIVVRSYPGDEGVLKTAHLIDAYNVGAVCFFHGGPIGQAEATNYYQTIAKTPLMVTEDAEYGLGMRLDSVNKFPYQLTLGALT